MGYIKLKKRYLSFLDGSKKTFPAKAVYYCLLLLSFLYAFLLAAKNFLYDSGILKPYCCCRSFLVGVGNISWAGSGKTPFSLWLYQYFSPGLKTAILRRGYGADEEKLIRENCSFLFSSPDRRSLVKKLEKDYKFFILDDAFQYRKLKKDVEIVVMGAREFEKKIRLIPASFFREPFKNIRRADILIVNYKEKVNRNYVKKMVASLDSPPEIYFAGYQAKNLKDLKGKEYDFDFLRGKRLAAFAAIGYPRGFFDLLQNTGFRPEKEIVYPDHHVLSIKEYFLLEKDLISSGVKNLIITEKDKYHFPECKKELAIFVLGVKLEVERKNQLIASLAQKINHKLKNIRD